MKRFYALLLFCSTAILSPCAARAAGGDAQSSAPAKASGAMTIPPDAVANPDNTWSYTDKQGKHWTYTRTPMGVTRVPAVRSASGAPPFYGVPDGAVRNANGTYSWTDKDGKKWIYMNSPFGLSRVAAPESSDSEPAPATSEWKVTDKGDSVRFERKGPMGNVVWEKKKTDLNEQERRAYESRKSQTKKAEPPQPQQ